MKPASPAPKQISVIPALIGITPKKEYAFPVIRKMSTAPNAMKSHVYSALLVTTLPIREDASVASDKILIALSAHPKTTAPNVFQLNTLKTGNVFLVDSWINVWSVMPHRVVQSVPNALMIGITSTNTRFALLVVSLMMAALNAQPKISALSVRPIVSTLKITSAEAAPSSTDSASNAQLPSTALNAYLTITISMMPLSCALPANQPWKAAPPAKPNKNAQTALRPTSSTAKKPARNAYRCSATASLVPVRMSASPAKAITTSTPINAKIAISLLPIALPARAIVHAISVSRSMYSPKINSVSSVKMSCRNA